MMANLIQERLGQAVRAVTVCETAIEWTVKYTRDRPAFGTTIFEFQNTQFTLADLDARIAGARAFTDACMMQMDAGTLDGVTMAQLKLVTMELQGKCSTSACSSMAAMATCANIQSPAPMSTPGSTASPEVRSR